jgi:hypothetical protein
VFEVLETNRTVSAAAGHGLHMSDSTARALDGLLAGTPSATQALAGFPAAQHAAVTASVHQGFLSALATTMDLSLGIVIGGIVLALLLIRPRPAVEPLPRPNVTEPFSGLAPRP